MVTTTYLVWLRVPAARGGSGGRQTLHRTVSHSTRLLRKVGFDIVWLQVPFIIQYAITLL